MKKNICALGLKAIIIIFLFGCQPVLAQTGMLQGSVKDEKGYPLAGASVTISGEKTGTATDKQGQFKLKLSPGNYTLTISFIDHSTLQEKIRINKGMTLQRNYKAGEVYKQFREVVVFCPRPKQRMTNISNDTATTPASYRKELKKIENSISIKYDLLFASSFNRDHHGRDVVTDDIYLNISRQLVFRIYRKWSLDPRTITMPVIFH